MFKSLFQSISAFCNAGFDLIGSENMVPFVTNIGINIVCMLLTTLGGLGFLVWDDISNCVVEGKDKKFSLTRIVKNLKLHTKLILIAQVSLVILGTFAFFVAEYHNPETIADFNIQDKLLISSFHSVSARTAGFASVNLANLNDITKIFMIILMFIGGGPGSVAGGIKTTTLIVLLLGVITSIRGKKHMNILKRTVSDGTFIKAVSVITIAITVLVVSNVILVMNSDIYVLDLLFESVSAFATVGLTSGALAEMNTFCQSIIIFLMYIGRVGTTTMAVAFVMKKPIENDLVVYAKEDIIVG